VRDYKAHSFLSQPHPAWEKTKEHKMVGRLVTVLGVVSIVAISAPAFAQTVKITTVAEAAKVSLTAGDLARIKAHPARYGGSYWMVK
jgi:hypothetical protein